VTLATSAARVVVGWALGHWTLSSGQWP